MCPESSEHVAGEEVEETHWMYFINWLEEFDEIYGVCALGDKVELFKFWG